MLSMPRLGLCSSPRLGLATNGDTTSALLLQRDRKRDQRRFSPPKGAKGLRFTNLSSKFHATLS
jgi:hypothetical protein